MTTDFKSFFRNCHLRVKPDDQGKALVLHEGDRFIVAFDGYAIVPNEEYESLLSSRDSARREAWIPVSERLPTHVHSVLIWVVNDGSAFVRDMPYVEIGIYNDRRGKWQMNYGDDDIDVSVTYWQPLPEPPLAQPDSGEPS